MCQHINPLISQQAATRSGNSNVFQANALCPGDGESSSPTICLRPPVKQSRDGSRLDRRTGQCFCASGVSMCAAHRLRVCVGEHGDFRGAPFDPKETIMNTTRRVAQLRMFGTLPIQTETMHAIRNTTENWCSWHVVKLPARWEKAQPTASHQPARLSRWLGPRCGCGENTRRE